MSRKRFYGRERNKLKFSKNGRALCRFCEKEVPPPKRTFCSKECVHEWKLRKSSSYVRYCLFNRDKGVCAICGTNTFLLKQEGKRMLKEGNKEGYFAFAKSLGMPARRKSWWDADHIVAVAEGGGECGLENYRTLCVPCHKQVTKDLQRRLSNQRKFKKPKWVKPPILLPASSLFEPKHKKDKRHKGDKPVEE